MDEISAMYKLSWKARIRIRAPRVMGVGVNSRVKVVE